MSEAIKLPLGFAAHVANIGIKDTSDDFVVIAASQPSPAAGVFTKSRFCGASVSLSRQNLKGARARAVVVLSKNANVATGAQGFANAEEITASVARTLGCAPTEVLIASTGVIGRNYPMDRIRSHLASMSAPTGVDALAAARGIMTTDTFAKVSSAAIAGSSARVVGIAKGVGMIEPDMATLLTFFFTDADIDAKTLDTVFRSVIDDTFNCVSVDTDTSTSDTAIVLASGAAGPVDRAAFAAALHRVALDLTLMVARDGEGATKLIEVRVDGARDRTQAKKVAKSIVNSPLVKTAVHGADPNWGRVAMAVGKCSDETDIDQERVVIRFGDQEVYPAPVGADGLDRLSAYMKGERILIHVSLGIATGVCTVYGCDLSDGYIRINADYTTCAKFPARNPESEGRAGSPGPPRSFARPLPPIILVM